MQKKVEAWLLEIEQATDFKALEKLKAELLGKTGVVSGALKALGTLDPEQRKEKGAEINAFRDQLNKAFSAHTKRLEDLDIQNQLKAQAVDITLQPAFKPLGKIHPLTQLMNEMKDFFISRGFDICEGIEIEDDWHNFDALNMPAHHPARQNHDTFYVAHHDDSAKPYLLRTHTSSVQIRTMKDKKPPLRVISIGRVYRSDALDATHTPMFHQIEGMVIDKTVNLCHLKGLLNAFCQFLFGMEKVPLRFRPSFFPFTEPSFEVDIACTRQDGKLIMGETGQWMELLGCGMVHPSVLKNCDIDPKQYQGFAFGVGIERLCMLRNGIVDIRQLYEGDAAWINHFGHFAL